MQTLEQVQAQIAALRETETALQAVVKQAAVDAAKTFVMEYDWEVTWPHEAKFRVERHITKDCADRLAAFKDQFPLCPYPPKPHEGGMTYSVLVGGFVEGGSGSVIVRFAPGDGYHSSFDPEPIRDDTLAALRAGIVPDDIKRP